MTIIDEFRGYLKIDKLALDDALQHQPSLLFKVSEAYELALADRDTLKDQLVTCEANLDVAFRKQLDANKIKYTEGSIKSLITIDKVRLNNVTLYNQARRKAAQLMALKEAFKERGYMLREMCSLYVSNYFEQNSSRPTPDSDAIAYNQRKAKIAAARRENS